MFNSTYERPLYIFSAVSMSRTASCITCFAPPPTLPARADKTDLNDDDFELDADEFYDSEEELAESSDDDDDISDKENRGDARMC